MNDPATPWRNRLIWGFAGLVLAAGMLLPAVHVAGAFLLVVGVTLPFLVWHWFGGSGSWMGMVTVGIATSVVLAAALILDVGCPADGVRVVLKEGKPPVSCTEVRASYMSMAVFFAVVAAIGALIPSYLKRLPPPDMDDDSAASE